MDRPLTEEELTRLIEPSFEPRHSAGRPTGVPAFCEWLFCLAVEPEFHEDRLADYHERFNRLWVPKFGQRAAVFTSSFISGTCYDSRG
jgi:hypothetical protein